MENIQGKERLYMSTLLGAKPLGIISDLENLMEKFFDEKDIKYVKSASTIFFCFEGDIDDLNQSFKSKISDSAYVIMDITDNLNVFDFRGYITKEHDCSQEFISIISRFIKEEEDVEKKLTKEERLKLAIEIEDYETASKLRDEINNAVN